MRDLFKNKLFIFLVIALVILGGLAAFTAGNRAAVTWVEDAINTVAQPIQRFSVRASNSIIDFFERVFKTSDADRENEQLKVRIAQYEIMENELVMTTDAYKNGNIVYLAHPAVWYTAEGGITALDIMLQDLEAELLQ